MANMCNNWVKFRGADLTEIKRLMADAIKSNEGWLPDGIDGDRCLFDVCLHEDWYQFITKWSPPIDEMVAICRKAKVSFSMDYDELGFNIYGTAEYDYDTDILKQTDLDDEHFNRITEDGDGYLLDGKFVESVYDALYTMLEEVKKGKDIYTND